MTVDLTVDAILNHAPCPSCGVPLHANDVGENTLTAECSNCDWHGGSTLPRIRKTLIYLDNSTLSHIATAIARGERSSPWVALHEELLSAVHRNVICCPGSPVIDDESQLSKHVSRAVRELSLGLGNVRLNVPKTVQEKQLLRAFHNFLDGLPPRLEDEPPFSDVSDDDPHEWLPFVQFGSLSHATPAELEEHREREKTVVEDVSTVFKRYVSLNLTFEEIRRREAAGIGSTFRQVGPLFRFLHIAKKRHDETAAWQAVDDFLKSDHAVAIPAADITSRLYTAVAMAFGARSSRLPSPGDADDVRQIGSYLPYVDVLIADRFFAQVAAESASGLNRYRAKIQRLGEKHIADFIDWLRQLVQSADQAPLAEKIYNEVDVHGSFRKLTERLTRMQSVE